MSKCNDDFLIKKNISHNINDSKKLNVPKSLCESTGKKDCCISLDSIFSFIQTKKERNDTFPIIKSNFLSSKNVVKKSPIRLTQLILTNITLPKEKRISKLNSERYHSENITSDPINKSDRNIRKNNKFITGIYKGKPYKAFNNNKFIDSHEICYNFNLRKEKKKEIKEAKDKLEIEKDKGLII